MMQGLWSSTTLEQHPNVFKESRHALMFQYLPFTAGHGQRLRCQAAAARQRSWEPARQA
jgi:hypothetical protein